MNDIDKLIYNGWGLDEILVALEIATPAKPGQSYFWDALARTGDVPRAVRIARAEMASVLGSFQSVRRAS